MKSCEIIKAKMASIALMIGGAFLNATAFIGGSYLARTLSGKDADAERERHDKALEKYQRDYEAYQENRERISDWMREQEKAVDQAYQNLKTTDQALVLYNKVHENSQIPHLNEPQWNNYYRPSQGQKTGELVWVGGGMAVLAFAVSRLA